VDRDEHTNYSTPLIWENSVRTEIVTTGTARVQSYDLTGRPLSQIARMFVLTVPSPIAHHGLVFVSAGYIQDLHKGDVPPTVEIRRRLGDDYAT